MLDRSRGEPADHDQSPPGCGPLAVRPYTPDRPLRQQIFEQVRAAGKMPRVDIARELEISAATVTTATSDLIGEGYLEEAPGTRDPDQGRGRPPVALRVRGASHVVCGMKISNEVHTAVLLDGSGARLAEASRSRSHSVMDPGDALDEMDALFGEVCRKVDLPRSSVARIGLGLPGLIDHASGHVLWSPLLTGRGLDMATAAESRLGVPVSLDNDANMVTLAELWFGEGRHLADFAVVTIEHGVGMGLVVNNQLFRGLRGLGLELGHTKVQLDGALCRCGQRGCLEAYVADYALMREAATALNRFEGGQRTTLETLEALHARAKAGDKAALMIFRRAGRYLAFGLANIVNLFDPGLIIIAGSRMTYDALYADDVLNEMKDMSLAKGRTLPDIQINAWGDLVWAQGAAALALSVETDRIFAADLEATA